ncbi:MAG: sodium:proton antiporter [Planctomycetes bacterium]|nr:sodium:proton antiporter [Planctomycetota bacterium]
MPGLLLLLLALAPATLFGQEDAGPAVGAAAAAPAPAHPAGPALGARLPLWSVLPFVVLLAAIAILPLAAPHLWESNRNKAILALALGLPVGLGIGALDAHHLLETGREYRSFILLLAALYVISGGIHISGAPSGTPLINTAYLAVGALLASFIGTTGASMLLIRPILRANQARKERVHIVLFFILVVSNAGGLLTPLGDPPLFLGFLRGVPFFWTLRLILPWAMAVAWLLVLFHFVDDYYFEKEDLETRGSLVEEVHQKAPLVIEGKRNLCYLAGVIAAAFLSGIGHWPYGVREALMLGLVVASLRTTSRAVRAANEFSYGPIVEVAVLFAGIFLTMIPALALLHERGRELGFTRPWQFFWGTGLLSSVLDNAPTYLTFLALGQGLHLGHDVVGVPHQILSAISVGAVFMGANTYIGNGPNFMVKAIAEAQGTKMPSFGAYAGLACAIMLPLYVALTFAFYR